MKNGFDSIFDFDGDGEMSVEEIALGLEIIFDAEDEEDYSDCDEDDDSEYDEEDDYSEHDD